MTRSKDNATQINWVDSSAADATAITIDSSKNVEFAGDVAIVNGTSSTTLPAIHATAPYGSPVTPNSDSDGDRLVFWDTATQKVALGMGSDNSVWVQSNSGSGTNDAFAVWAGANSTLPSKVFNVERDGDATFSGTVEIGTFSNTGATTGFRFEQPGSEYSRSSVSTTSAKIHHYYYNPNGIVGSISTSGTATSYTTSSDYRLKEDVQPMVGASDRVMALKPVNFAWKADGTRTDGFLAHEAAAIVTDSVVGEKDAVRDEDYEASPAKGCIITAGKGKVEEIVHKVDVVCPESMDEGQEWREETPAVIETRSVPSMQGIDQSKLVPLLTAALQEALTSIADLEGRLAALETE